MKRTITILSFLLLLIACTPYGVTKVNLRKAFRQKTSAKDLYARVDVIPLRVPEGVRIGPEETMLEVAADRFFLLNQEKDTILVFDGAGEYLTAIRSEEPVIDFSPYLDRALTVLTAHAITEYAIRDGSTLGNYPIRDNDIDLQCATRIGEQWIDLLGSKAGKAYGCVYYVDQKRLGSSEMMSSLHSVMPASEVQDSRYFHDRDSCYMFMSQSGLIFKFNRDLYFAGLAFEPDFGKEEIHFINAQKAGNSFYLAFEKDGESGVLVCNFKNGKYKAVRKTKEGTVFPLGVIRDGVNYYCCPARRLEEFVLPGTVTLPEDTEYILLKYTL